MARPRDARDRRPRVAAVALAALGVVVWARSVGTPFVFDDRVAIVDNPNVRRLWPPWAAASAPPRSVLSGRPLPALTLALDHAVGGLDPRGYHATNVALHVVAGLLLFGIVRRTLATPPLAARFGADALGIALAIAAIWLVHPLHTDAVTYVTQRTELVMAVCWLLALWLAIRDRPVAGVVCCALGMASKEPMAGAPLVVLLWDRLFRHDSLAAALRARGRFYAGLAATWVVLVALLLVPRHASIFGDAIGPLDYARTEAGVLVDYLRLAVWPAGLSIDHGVWVAREPSAWLPPALAVAALLAATAVALARGAPIGFLGAWFFVVLAPTSSVVPITTEVMAERRMYLPLAAVVALGVTVGARVVRRRDVRVAATAAVVVALALTTVRRIGDYASEIGLWQAAVRTNPENVRAHVNLGALLLEEGRVDAAAAAFARAYALEPNRGDVRYELGTVALARGDLDDAGRWFAAALAADPDLVDARYNLGTVRLHQGRLDDAIAELEAVVARAPDHAYAAQNLRVARERLAARRTP